MYAANRSKRSNNFRYSSANMENSCFSQRKASRANFCKKCGDQKETTHCIKLLENHVRLALRAAKAGSLGVEKTACNERMGATSGIESRAGTRHL